MRYTLTLVQKDGSGRIFRSGKIRRIFHRLHVGSWHRAYVKVDYGNNLINEGWYNTEAEAMLALSTFVEAELLNYIQETTA